MNFFPVPYPDEVLSSVLARYSIRSGNIKIIHNMEDLFGTRNAIAVMEFPTKLNKLVENMPVGTKYTAEYFIYNHTLFPYYSAFITKERGEQIISSMKTGEGDVYIRAGVITSQISLSQYYRFCPECIKEDFNLYGELYWHRVHQAAGVFVCPRHKVPTYNSRILVRGYNRQKFQLPKAENCIVGTETKYSDEMMSKLLLLAQDVEVLLNNYFNFYPPRHFKNKYRDKLIEKGYAKLNNMIHQKKLSKDLLEYYGEEFLKAMQCKFNINGECKWLADMVRDNEKPSHVLRHLILARFLEIPVYELFNNELSLKYNEETRSTNKDVLAINSKDLYLKVWEDRLRELIEEKLSLRQIAKELNSTPKTIKKHIERLGIDPFWKYNGGKRYGNKNYRDTEEFKIKREECRSKWLKLIADNPDKSRNELKLMSVTLGTWLLRHDKEWMINNSPDIKSSHKPVDWDKRDMELLPQVINIVDEILKGEKERICWTTIGSKLGISGWLSKKKDKLPLTKAYINSVEESIEKFQIRKIKRAIDKIEVQEEITYWRLLEAAGVKERYIGAIKKDVEKIFHERGLSTDMMHRYKDTSNFIRE